MAFIETTTTGGYFSTAQAVTTTANSTNVLDLTGAGSGTAPAMIGAGGVNTALGYDLGAGEGVAMPQVQVNFTSVASSANTITVALQAAPDNGSYSPGSYVTVYSSAAIAENTLVAGNTLTFWIPPVPPEFSGKPRFYRLVYTCSAAVTITLSAFVTFNAPTGQEIKLYGSNFVSV